jgi:hypothetical protein
MKKHGGRAFGLWCAALFLFSLCLNGLAQPPIPSQFFYFPDNLETVFGSPPLAFTTNLVLTPMDVSSYDGNALVLDTTNLCPAYLCYNILDTHPHTNRNLNYASGTVLWYFTPNWQSVSQGGTGPGTPAYLLAGGDWRSNSPGGQFLIYVDAPGSNFIFGGMQNGEGAIYASAPISWASNSWHQIGVEWTANSDCEIYLDGALAATGDGPTIVPGRSTWTNGFFIGSDGYGFEQSRGATFSMML